MLTPEHRAELRGLAESAQPFIRHGGTDPAAVYVPAADLTALLDAADERDRLAAASPCREDAGVRRCDRGISGSRCCWPTAAATTACEIWRCTCSATAANSPVRLP